MAKTPEEKRQYMKDYMKNYRANQKAGNSASKRGRPKKNQGEPFGLVRAGYFKEVGG